MRDTAAPLDFGTGSPGDLRRCGVGLGLRREFLDQVADGPDLDVAFFEIAPENFMRRGGAGVAALERVVARYPVVTHGLTMSLGAIEPPLERYLADLQAEIERTRTPWHSDHLCFSTAGPVVLHDLLPVRFCAETVRRIADRLRRVEDRIGVPMAIENISWYAHPGRMEMSEADLICGVVEASGCGLLLDVNNVWVNALNHGFDPREQIRALPLDRVVEIHVAGHTRVSPDLVVDTHGSPVCGSVLELLEWTLERTGPVPVLLERDEAIPPLAELLEEVETIAAIHRRVARRHGVGRAEEVRAGGA